MFEKMLQHLKEACLSALTLSARILLFFLEIMLKKNLLEAFLLSSFHLFSL